MLTLCASGAADSIVIPPAPREFRGLWVASVSNLDWPSQRDLTPQQQQKELEQIFDRAEQLRMNAVIFQVRPAGDALYQSDLEPWSFYLTGKQGQAPEPLYDPLKLAVEEAHKRGMELHAWFNPYRAGIGMTAAELAPEHLGARHPELVYQYGNYLWMDPGRLEVQDHTAKVILDVVKRYDIDAVHFDDYFYPYLARDGSGKLIPFPDDATYAAYRAEGGTLSRERWREENVNTLIKRLSKEIKDEKSHVKFGISPFGIWKPGFPTGVVGLDSVKELHADSRLWWRQGWVDYLVPQLYWKLETPGHSYEQLLNWWASENVHHRHLFAGNAAHKLAGNDTWPAEEIVNQVAYTRELAGASGNVFFNANVFMKNAGQIGEALGKGPYIGDALPPASPWLDKERPAVPRVRTAPADQAAVVTVEWEPADEEKPFLWAVYAYVNDAWRMEVVPQGQTSLKVAGWEGKPPALIAVSAVDRMGNESDRALVRLDKSFVPPGSSLTGADSGADVPAAPVPQGTLRSRSGLPVLFSASTSDGPRLPTTPTPSVRPTGGR